MVCWVIEQHCECHGQCLSAPCTRSYQRIHTLSFSKNNSQLHLLWYASSVSDTPADHTSTMANCFVLIILVLLKFSPEPKFEPEILRTGPKSSSKFSPCDEPDLKFSSGFSRIEEVRTDSPKSILFCILSENFLLTSTHRIFLAGCDSWYCA